MKTERQLEIKDLAPYLPYGLKGGFRNRIEILKSCTNGFINREILYEDYKPILRPLSDLTKEIEHKGERFVPIDVLSDWTTIQINDDDSIMEAGFDGEMHEIDSPLEMAYCQVENLLKWHFDVFGLIESGLAIDINELNEKQ
jgi:hypothetical protein